MKTMRNVRFELAVFLMDYHSGQWSRGYRLLSRLGPFNFSASFCAEMRETETYESLVSKFADKV
jgi:hypothetical protein